MVENSRPPVAIRIVRPHGSVEELLEDELDTIGKTSVVLIGAQPRPTGVILRFEMTLGSGPTVLRGEGRVLAHKDNAFRGQAGLVLRFTRLDPKSKAIVDRATAMREARGPAAPPSVEAQAVQAVQAPQPSRPPSRHDSRPAPRPDSPIATALSAPTPIPAPIAAVAPPIDQETAVASARAAAREKANATARTNARRTGRPPDFTPTPGRPAGLTPPPPPSIEAPAQPMTEIAEIIAVAPDPPQVLAPFALLMPETEALTAIPGEVAAVTAIPGEVQPRTGTRTITREFEAQPAQSQDDALTAIPGAVAASPAEPAAIAELRAPVTERGLNPQEEERSARDVTVATAQTHTAPGAGNAPENRDALLARLRERAGRLPRERVEEILAEGAAR